MLASVAILELGLRKHICSELNWFIKEEKEKKCGNLQINIFYHENLHQ